MTTLDERLAAALLAREATVATAESCTAGLVAGRLADRPGSSAYLIGGFVTYANEAKTAEVGVPEDLLARVGAVSEEVAVAMAQGARARLGTTYGVSTTGVAGPGGGTPDKPVGLVHVAVASAGAVRHRRLQLDGNRAQVRADSVTASLELLLEALGD
ncbi:nicotinamide-nucleotide amidohydrolase family protein [Nocardioides sp. JQ2195]|uniref:CinA family protein n=1 Tax=Nocardioides sp. JQ2195 TaxID=2592334 RepID=UPI00143EA26D|nr:nicotinamide-nucleotide amidohydrolase family protein [Nocardioides sp. JQ2195]QIX26656.1 nicotinamide-nucleotide amidohydrolase family protein [Nocardioides sp. JQ2195]